MNGIYDGQRTASGLRRVSVTRSTRAQHRGRTSLGCTCNGMVPSASRRELPTTQDSAASVGPGLYIDSLHITRTQEVVLGSAVTPIKGARLRSIRMLHRPCLALPRLALPRLGTSITIAIRETEPSAVCVVRIVYITAFDNRA